MKLIISILLKGKEGKGRKHVKKTFDTNIIPSKDCKIEDLAWKKEREIVNIIINYSENYCMVELSPDEDNYDLEEKLKMYLNHSWEKLA